MGGWRRLLRTTPPGSGPRRTGRRRGPAGFTTTSEASEGFSCQTLTAGVWLLLLLLLLRLLLLLLMIGCCAGCGCVLVCADFFVSVPLVMGW